MFKIKVELDLLFWLAFASFMLFLVECCPCRKCGKFSNFQEPYDSFVKLLRKETVSDKILAKNVNNFDVFAKNRFKKGGKTDRIED